MEGAGGQWEVVLYNPLEKQTVLYNRYDHSLRILDGRAYTQSAPLHHHGSGPIPMPPPPRRTSIDYFSSNGGTTTTTAPEVDLCPEASRRSPVVRVKSDKLGIAPSSTPAFPEAGRHLRGRCPLCRQHLPPYLHLHHDPRKPGSPPTARCYVSPNYFDIIDLEGASASVPPDLDDDLNDSSSDESDNSEEDEDYERHSEDRRRTGARMPGSHRQRTQSLRSRAFNQGYYNKFFVEESCLGRGAFGSVYLCHHVLGEVNLGKYALKKVPVGNDHPRLAAVLQEVKALERLQHPNIISYKHSWLERTKPADFGPDNIPTLFILTEYANSGNLHDFIFYNKDRIKDNRARAKRASYEEKRATLNPLMNTTTARTYFLDNEMIWTFFTDICNGLSHLHHRGIIHCDLKPQNLLLDKTKDAVTQRETTRVLISDFGSVKSLLQGERAPRTGNTGTIAYMAPEALITDSSGRYLYDYDEKSDVWSLGVILYEMCFSESPFRNANSTEDLEREIIGTRGITEFPSTPLPRSAIFTWLIQWMMQGDPAKRPSVDDILSLPEVMSRNSGTSRQPTPAEPPPPLSTAYLLELPPQIVQTTIPGPSPGPKDKSSLVRRRSTQLMPPPLAPARPLSSSSPAVFGASSSSSAGSSSSSAPGSPSSGLRGSMHSSTSSAPFPKSAQVINAIPLPAQVASMLAAAVNFCTDHFDAFMRQSLFAIALIVKLALCWEMTQSWPAWYIHLMVSLSLGTMLLCLPAGWTMAGIQASCIVSQWLLAVVWWWHGPTHERHRYDHDLRQHEGVGLLWELFAIMLIELMLSLLFATLKLAKAERTRSSYRRR